MFDVFAQMAAIAGQGIWGRVDVTDPGQLAEQPVRRRLLALIAEQPGIHASQLCREAGEPWGTVQYHLGLLYKGELVTSVEAGRERLFFPSEMDPARASMLAVLHQGRREEIARYINENPGARQVDICDALDVSRKTFRSSIEPLVERGLVNERKGLQSNRYFPKETLAPALDGGFVTPPAQPTPFPQM